MVTGNGSQRILILTLVTRLISSSNLPSITLSIGTSKSPNLCCGSPVTVGGTM